MITAHKKHHVKSIPKATKLAIALQAIKGKKTISAISKGFFVGRYEISQSTLAALCQTGL